MPTGAETEVSFPNATEPLNVALLLADMSLAEVSILTLLPKIKLFSTPDSIVLLLPTMPELSLLTTFSLPRTLALLTSMELAELPILL